MDKASLPERVERRDSTRSVVADANLCRQIACILFTEEKPIRDAFEGEPVMEAMLMVAWCLDKENEDARFDAAIALPAWAKKRGRGAWRQPRGEARIWYGSSDAEYAEIDAAVEGTIKCSTIHYEDCADCHARRRREQLWEVQAEHAENHPGLIPGELLCDGCSVRHGIR